MYTDKTTIENYLLLDIDDSYNDQIDKFILSMSNFIDKECDRKIVAEEGEESETKYYDGNGNNSIRIDDAISIEKVEIGNEYGEDLTEITDFIKYPRISPYTKLLTKTSVFTKGVQNIAVHGTFGLFSSVPDDIKFACTVLVAGIIINQTLPKQSIVSEKIGDYSVSYRAESEQSDYNKAKEIIDNYKKISI